MSDRKCTFCGKVETLPFRCKYCKNSFCAAHRLPESHKCSNFPPPAFSAPTPHLRAEETCEMCYTTHHKLKNCPMCGGKFCPMHIKPKDHDCIRKQPQTREIYYSASTETAYYQPQPAVQWNIGTWTLGSEKRDLLVGAILVLLVFISPSFALLGLWLDPLIFILLILGPGIVIVTTAFIGHELAHRFVSIRLGYFSSRFVLWREGTIFTLFSALLGIMGLSGIICPGFVLTEGVGITKDQSGKIAAAGPLTNLIFGLSFLTLFFTLPSLSLDAIILLFLRFVARQAFWINISLGLFNLLPFGPLDGKKILDWNRTLFAFLFGANGLLWLIGWIVY
ncbi:MAG: AN1-type zinc finger domain-containing protein [Promethearchaeota archaeon]